MITSCDDHNPRKYNFRGCDTSHLRGVVLITPAKIHYYGGVMITSCDEHNGVIGLPGGVMGV